jgi:4-carboxymuconolactone decarboxylase
MLYNITSSATGRYRSLLSMILICMSLLFHEDVTAQNSNQMVRLAKLQIDSAQLEKYKVALKEEIETSLQVEPGVFTLYAIAEKNNPTHITILEIYANEEAYKKHLQTPHFIKYKTATKDMVKALELVETEPIVPGAKVKQ